MTMNVLGFTRVRDWGHYAWLLPLGAVVAIVTIYTPYFNGPPIRSDGAGYHAWTRALHDRDLSFCRWSKSAEGIVSYIDPVRERCQNKYPVGLALFRYPVMAWLVNPHLDATVITPAEHQACLVIGAVTLLATVWLWLWSCRLLQLSAWRSGIAVTFTVFGAGLFHYSTYDASFSHAYSAFFVSILLALGIRERAQLRPIPVTALIACAFFLTAIRNTNICVLLALSLAWLHANVGFSRQIFMTKSLSKVLRVALPIAVGVLAAFAFQILDNYYIQGKWTISTYGSESFVFDRPMQLAVLLSYERGLFTYYPLFGLGLVCGFTVSRSRACTWLLAGLVAAYATLYGYWHSWYLGGGMGHRGFVEITPVLAVVLAFAWDRLPRLAWRSAFGVALLCSLLTTEIMWGYWRGSYPIGGADARLYWEHVRLLESSVTGGTACRLSQCDLTGCHKTNRPILTQCTVSGFTKIGYCTGEGACAPVVALRSASSSSELYVSAPPGKKRAQAVLSLHATRIGAWEKFLLITNHAQRGEVYLYAVEAKAYVTLAEERGDMVLSASAKEHGPLETFTLQRDHSSVALRGSNMKFVAALPLRKGKGEAKSSDVLMAAADDATSGARFSLKSFRLYDPLESTKAR